MIFLRRVSHLKNVISSDQLVKHEREKIPRFLGKSVSNAIFHFEANSPVMEGAIRGFSESFNGAWASGGPTLLSKSLRRVCGADEANFAGFNIDIFT